MARSVKCLTLDFSSDHDLRVYEFEPQVGAALGAETLGLQLFVGNGGLSRSAVFLLNSQM